MPFEASTPMKGSVRPDGIEQIREVAPGAGADLQHGVTRFQVKGRHRLAASHGEDQVERLERAAEAGDAIVLPAVGAL
jgi:hypothetical protein